MIEIDGSQGEGGGQIARTAMALSCLTRKEFKIIKIRAGRPQPGLKAQHLEAIKALKQICNAETNSVEIGSTDLTFKPGKINKGAFEIDIGTAGSITLLLQALLLPCMFAPGKVTLKIRGGTSGKWQASVDYLQNILLPHLRRFVENINLKILKRGYYPKGGGEIILEISPKIKLKDFANFDEFWTRLKEETIKIDLVEQGDLEQVKGVVNCSNQLEKGRVAERIKQGAETELKRLGCPVNIRMEYVESLSPGGELVLWTVFSNLEEVDLNNPIILGGDALAEKGKSAEEVGKEAALEVMKEIESRGCVDKHLSDQLLVFIGLLPGSKVKVSEMTSHCQTNMEVIEKFLEVKFKMEDNLINVLERAQFKK
ncbi:MAG: RNA 3'-terminal phosphate cyclase [Candidatus Woesearchaeota archaeon]